MTRSPATPGPTGPLWCRSRAQVTYARPPIRATTAAAAAHAGQKMSEKSNTRSTKFFPGIWNRKRDHKLRVQASSLSLRARVQAEAPKLQGTSNQYKSIFFMFNME